MDQLMAMRAFSRVVEAGNFTRAADSLAMPNATMSKLIQELEAHLGVRLLHRTTRRVTVTPEGREYYEKSTRILRDLEDIDGAFNAARSKPRGQLRIDIGGSTACDVLIPALPDFLTRYPDIHIDLGVSDRTVDLISDNVDCVIRGGPLENSSLIARYIGSATFVTCATPSYLKCYGTPSYPEELKNGHRLVSFISPQNGKASPFRFERQGEKKEIKIDHRIGINESNAHLAAALAGIGIVQTFSYSAGKAIEEGVLTEILQEWRPAPYPFHVVYPQNRHVTHRLRVFIEWLLEIFPQRVKGAG
ncbi:LysR family transcriptional regulator [Dickeya fangzhongdai]|uniref:LysR family transcriptional regulator n=1 Tax=Dickeya fangzhongdai TaxID=1778540 RepID=UPI000574AF4C|nr:LysR family transcriptional regulator [Dickeya fangzhongdai]KHN56692.1 LysR family transcriptional regulator [Dickeya fangzhongdai]MBO8133880.1 LysR family transcriptional regulator [Dickeya fangzhongdai]WPD75057.1 LysR family transcriptional regulator [Dickeya fangzhongdai]